MGYGPGAKRAEAAPSGAIPGRDGEAPETQTLDRAVVAVLATLGADVPGFMTGVVSDFVDAVDRHLAGMRAALRSGDAAALEFAAHSLKGSCGIIGARRMAALSGHAETAAAARRAEDALPLVESLEREYPAVRSALEDALAAMGGTRVAA